TPPDTARPALPSFPTRRSSDLDGPADRSADHPGAPAPADARAASRDDRAPPRARGRPGERTRQGAWRVEKARCAGRKKTRERRRREEHTSELQSPCKIVCRLLL